MKFISIDGDDIGRKITSFYLNNNSIQLKQISDDLVSSTSRISELLKEKDFEIIFCAADGVVSCSKIEHNFSKLFNLISELSPTGITFSAGVGNSLRESYIALLSAKSDGKNCLHYYSELDAEKEEL